MLQNCCCSAVCGQNFQQSCHGLFNAVCEATSKTNMMEIWEPFLRRGSGNLDANITILPLQTFPQVPPVPLRAATRGWAAFGHNHHDWHAKPRMARFVAFCHMRSLSLRILEALFFTWRGYLPFQNQTGNIWRTELMENTPHTISYSVITHIQTSTLVKLFYVTCPVLWHKTFCVDFRM